MDLKLLKNVINTENNVIIIDISSITIIKK